MNVQKILAAFWAVWTVGFIAVLAWAIVRDITKASRDERKALTARWAHISRSTL